MNLLYGWTFHARRRTCSLKKLSEALGDILAVRNYSTSSTSESLEQISNRHRHELRTLHADKLSSVGQQIFDISHLKSPLVRIRISDEALPKTSNGQDNLVRFYYGSRSSRYHTFPAGTRGVLYLHYVRGDEIQSQVRFRLCNTLVEFHDGKDLRGLDGSPWNLTLKALARASAQYRPALALLQQEFPIEPQNIDSSRCGRRVIFTLDPQKLPSSGQSVMNFSELVVAKVHDGESGADSRIDLYYKRIGHGGKSTTLAYPPGTIGVFYYKQSFTAPTRLGELRFRLCHNIQEFAQGKDLCFPSGDPWCVSSLSIYSGKTYQALQNWLNKEGLLSTSLLPSTPNYRPGQTAMPLRVLSDPFVVDLSNGWIRFDIMNNTCTAASRINLQNRFRNNTNPKNPLFSGRAVVRLEEYPSVLPSDDPVGRLVAMRFLEMLTPIHRLSDDDLFQLPRVGELLLRRWNKTDKYVPWGYNPSRDRRLWIDWIARSRA